MRAAHEALRAAHAALQAEATRAGEERREATARSEAQDVKEAAAVEQLQARMGELHVRTTCALHSMALVSGLRDDP